MEYFFYCRAKPQAGELWAELTEAHWSFMDAYADAMIARGPTLNEDGTALTGSMHIVDLPNEEAARAFAFDEPNYRAGVYVDVMIRRWRNELARTMWESSKEIPPPTSGSLSSGTARRTATLKRRPLSTSRPRTSSTRGTSTDSSNAGRSYLTTARDGSAARCWSRCPIVPASRRCSPAIRS
jgi:uncharacterized protein YciI